MYCRCGKQSSAGYTAMPVESGGFNYHFWVCANCLKPSYLVFKGITHMNYPKRATALTSVVGHADGRTILTWNTVTGEKVQTMVFQAYPRKADMDQGRNVCLELWHRLDHEIDLIRSVASQEHLEYNKTRATTLAETIALVMSPFYDSADAVLRESMTRWTARQEGRDHESPGLAEAVWDPNTRFDGTPYSREAEERVRTRNSATIAPAKLDEQKTTFVKHALSTGAMTPEALAGMFGVSVEVIKAAVDE